MNAYFDIILQLTWMMLFITVVALPCMMIFGGYDTLAANGLGLQAYTVGNLGGSSISCAQAPLGEVGTTLALSCPTGLISTTAQVQNNDFAYQAGIIPNGANASNYCMVDAMITAESQIAETVTTCQTSLNQPVFLDYISERCNGKSTCAINNFYIDGSLNADFFLTAGIPAECFG